MFGTLGYRGFYYDESYILILIGVILSLLASAKVKTTFRRFSQVRSLSGYTGASAAELILHNAGIYDVRVQHVPGNLTDHYDPRNKTLNLSDSVYGSTSVAAIGVAAHEVGHAIQHARNYAPLSIRNAIVPVANFGATISWPLILAGILISGFQPLITVGILAFSFAVLFQIITLPVEFNASRRAINILGSQGILRGDEVGNVRKVLTAAALTYVAAAVSSILQLLRLIYLFGGRDRD